MKIAQVCPYDLSRPGGVKNHIFGLSDELEKFGHTVTIIAPNGSEPSHDNRIRLFGRNRSLKISGTKIDLNVALGDDRRNMKSFLHSQQFDIIHYHTFWNPLIPYQVWKHSNARNIVTFHDTPKQKWLGKTVMPMVASVIFRMMDRVISVSNSQANNIGGADHPRIKIIPNGLEIAEYQSPAVKMSEFDDGKFNLLFLGRLEPRKGVIYVLEAYRSLKNSNPQLRLIIAGEGQEKELVTSYTRDHKLKDVVVLGQVDEPTKISLLKSADLYLAPAIFGESFGIVLLEAMASGLPMVGFGNEGYLNIIPDIWARFFPKPRDQQAFTEAVNTMINQKTIRDDMITWGLEAVKKYEWSFIAREVEKIYLSALK
ncbi:MAG: glycosyltransferase family 4 protein [Cyclobacteriaceae bacterium]